MLFSSLHMYGIFQQSNTAWRSLFTAYYCEVESYSLYTLLTQKTMITKRESFTLTKEGRPQTLEVRTKEKKVTFFFYYYCHINTHPLLSFHKQ